LSIAELHYFDLYFEISDRFRRIQEGVCSPLEPGQFLDWQKLTKSVVFPWEYDILHKMDEAYCSEMNKELEDFRVRQSEPKK